MININATLLIQLANFLLLMFLLNRLLFRPMVRVLAERKARTEGRKERAAKVDAEAESVLADYRRQIQEAKAAADQSRSRLVRDGEAERNKLLGTAAREAEKTVTEIRARVRAEAEDARKALGREAEAIADEMATRILGRAL